MLQVTLPIHEVHVWKLKVSPSSDTCNLQRKGRQEQFC